MEQKFQTAKRLGQCAWESFLILYDSVYRKFEAKPVLSAASGLPSGDFAPAGAEGQIGRGVTALIAPGVDGLAH